MKVGVLCESSGAIRNAMLAAGHDCLSCDLLPADDDSPYHRQMDVFEFLAETGRDYDLLIAHPPCTQWAVSGARWMTRHWVKSKKHEAGGYWHDPQSKLRLQAESWEFICKLWSECSQSTQNIVFENPIGMLSTRWRLPDQIVQPWMFGDPFFKATCFWFGGSRLKPLQRGPVRTDIPDKVREPERFKAWSAVHQATPGPDRWKIRSKTYPGIAQAAVQWAAQLAA